MGSDIDLGGNSIAHFDLGPEGNARFWGKLSSELREGRRKEGVIERGGYAGMRSKVTFPFFPQNSLAPLTLALSQSRTTIFGPRTWDTSLHDFLRLRVRSSGDGMRYFVNIQTDGPGTPSLHTLLVPSY